MDAVGDRVAMDAEGAQMQVAAKRPGVNSNVLAGTDRFDPLSGNAVFSGIPVEVAPVGALTPS